MEKTQETVRAMTDGQKSDIIATMVGAMPSLDFDQAQAIIGNKGPFVADIGEAFRRHAGKPATAQSSAEFTITGRTYELVPYIKEGETCVSGDAMVERAKELNANLGEEDRAFILEHQHEIPPEFRGKFYMVFTAWRSSSNPRDFACLSWIDDRWYQGWVWLDGVWYGSARLVRRVS